MTLPDFSDPLWFLVATAVLFAIVIGRYFLVAGLFYSIFYWRSPAKWSRRKISDRGYKEGQFRKEVFWSCVTTFIFAISGAVTVLLWQKGKTKVYLNLHDYPLWWLPVSLVIAMIVHETYYYWLHRWMHQPA